MSNYLYPENEGIYQNLLIYLIKIKPFIESFDLSLNEWKFAGPFSLGH